MIQQIKRMIVFLGVASVAFLNFNTLHVNAAMTDSVPMKENIIHLYSAVPIYDVNELTMMALNGVDEFARETGIEWSAETEGTAIFNVNSYQTSQLINEYISDGSLYKEYAISFLVSADVKQYGENPVSKNNCTMRTTMFVTWNADFNRATLSFQSTWVSGGSPTVLVMENKVDKGWDTGKSYVNSSQVLNPNGTYTLLAPSSEAVGDSYGADLWCQGTVYFTGGSSLVSSINIRPGEIIPPSIN